MIIFIPASLRCERVCQDQETNATRLREFMFIRKKQMPTFHPIRTIKTTQDQCMWSCLTETDCMQFTFDQYNMVCDHMTRDVVDFEKETEGYFKYCL